VALRAWSRHRARRSAGDGGFTLIELLVSMTVMAIGVIGVMGVMQSSMGVVVRTNRRSAGMNFATQTIEAYRAIPYSQLTPASTTSTTTKTVKGTTYTASSGITWASDGVTTQAYKQVTVDVTWTDRAGFHDVRQGTVIYNGDSTAATSTTQACNSGNAPSPPTNLVANTPFNVSGTTGVDLTWTPPATTSAPVAFWKVQWSVDNFSTYYTVTNALSATVTALRVNGLSSGTNYQFRVQALSICGATSSWSPIASATTYTAAALLCIPGSASVSPTGTGRVNNGAKAVLAVIPLVSINTSGTCTTFTMKYSPTSGVQRTGSLGLGTGGVYSGQIPTANSDPWDVGQHSIDIYDSINVKRATVVLTVCEKNVSSC
jgi:prepilin-type N-terminal cleavage/methylation domain-containing protein